MTLERLNIQALKDGLGGWTWNGTDYIRWVCHCSKSSVFPTHKLICAHLNNDCPRLTSTKDPTKVIENQPAASEKTCIFCPFTGSQQGVYHHEKNVHQDSNELWVCPNCNKLYVQRIGYTNDQFSWLFFKKAGRRYTDLTFHGMSLYLVFRLLVIC